jgi:tRNA/rRNA methyltransferase
MEKNISPTIILVRPQMAENIGAVARAMGNFGLGKLILVAPCVNHICDTAIANAAGADIILQNARVFDALADATAEFSRVFGTVHKPRDFVATYYTPAAILNKNYDDNTCLVFGPERTGLTNEDMMRCQSFIQIPTDPHFSSLNLAQAVLIVAYEFFIRNKNISESVLHLGETQLATNRERQILYTEVEKILDKKNYWRTQHKKPIMWQNFLAFMNRIDFTRQDIKSLLGILKERPPHGH